MLARDGTGQVFDFESGTFGPRTLPVPDDFGPFAFSGDGRLLATTGYGRDILVRDLITGSAHAPLNPRSGVVEDLQEFETVEVLAFSPDSARLLAATTLGTLRIWDAASGRIELEISEPNGRIDQAIFSPDGEVVAVIHRSTVRLLDVATGAMIEDIAVWHAESLAFSADGRHLFVANPEATFRWRVPELPDQPERIGRWVEIRALAEWGEQSSPTPIGLAEWTQTWRRLDAAGGPFR
jgi:WD40 repeat protein